MPAPVFFEVVSLTYRDIKPEGVPHAVVLVFGRTADGLSVCARVHNFKAYFYATPTPTPASASAAAPPTTASGAVQALRHAVLQEGKKREWLRPVQVHAEECERIPLVYYHERPERMFRVSLSTPRAVVPFRAAITEGRVPGLQPRVFEANFDYVLRLMADKDIRTGKWVRATGMRMPRGGRGPLASTCDIVLQCAQPEDIAALDAPPPELGCTAAPQRLLAFDIECSAPGGNFPTADKDRVIQIGCDLATLDARPVEEVDAASEQVLFALGETGAITLEDIEGTGGGAMDVRSFASAFGVDAEGNEVYVPNDADEIRMLEAFAKYITDEADPDIITGYNIFNFDWKYLIDRAEHLGCTDTACRLGRLAAHITANDVKAFTSAAHGSSDENNVDITGRVIFDVYTVVKRREKLRSYKLDDVAERFLGQKKQPVKYSEITALWQGTPATRARLGKYCVVDAILSRRLLFKRKYWIGCAIEALVTGVPSSYIVSRGQQIKVHAQIIAKGNARGFAVDYIPPRRSGDKSEEAEGGGDGGAARGEKRYEGATVIEPQRGFHQQPVVTLDFKALYPSIMQAHNLCYSTLLRPADAEAWLRDRPGDVEVAPTGDVFVRSHVRRGVLPRILDELGAARSAAKRLMATAATAHDRNVFDARQLSLKLCANSVYGFTGAHHGRLPTVEIARSVTAYGRAHLQTTRDYITATYSAANGYPADAEIVYGDTDSVMVKFGTDVYEEAVALGNQAAAAVTALFPPPVELEYEKLYNPYLLISKKRYAGLMYTEDGQPPKIATAGIETQRRDNAPLVPRVQEAMLKELLENRDSEAAAECARGAVRDLIEGAVSHEDLTISKAYSKRIEDYKVAQAHIKLIVKMQGRPKSDPAVAEYRPVMGDRIPYIIAAPTKEIGDPKPSDRAEAPEYMAAHGLEPDALYYVQQQLLGPCVRVLKPIYTGGSEEATKEILRDMRFRRIPSRGVVQKRMSPDVRRALGLMGSKKRLPPPSADNDKWQSPAKRARGDIRNFFAAGPAE